MWNPIGDTDIENSAYSPSQAEDAEARGSVESKAAGDRGADRQERDGPDTLPPDKSETGRIGSARVKMAVSRQTHVFLLNDYCARGKKTSMGSEGNCEQTNSVALYSQRFGDVS